MTVVKYYKRLNLLLLDINCPMKSLQRDSLALMGKNTMMKHSIGFYAEKTKNNAFLILFIFSWVM